MKKLHVRPARGFTVRDPKTGKELPSEGAHVPDTLHWRRRIDEGQVERLDRETPEEKSEGKGSEGAPDKGGESKPDGKGGKGR